LNGEAAGSFARRAVAKFEEVNQNSTTTDSEGDPKRRVISTREEKRREDPFFVARRNVVKRMGAKQQGEGDLWGGSWSAMGRGSMIKSTGRSRKGKAKKKNDRES